MLEALVGRLLGPDMLVSLTWIIAGLLVCMLWQLMTLVKLKKVELELRYPDRPGIWDR